MFLEGFGMRAILRANPAFFGFRIALFYRRHGITGPRPEVGRGPE